MLNIRPKKFWFTVLSLLVLVFIAIPAFQNFEEEDNSYIKVFSKHNGSLLNIDKDTYVLLSIYGKDNNNKIVKQSVTEILVEKDGNVKLPPPINEFQILKVSIPNTNTENNLTLAVSAKEVVCHEAVDVMRVGPSKSSLGGRLQTTLSCCIKEMW
jgi:hypothetical protein